MTNKRKMLLVEDESHLAHGLKINFEFEGFEVTIAGTARSAQQALGRNHNFDIIVLDITLPDEQGFVVCQSLRQQGDHTPVLMLTARNLAKDRVFGLESGADDYLTKPFDLDELIARVKSLLRRQAWNNQKPQEAIFEFGDAKVNFSTHEAWMSEQQLKITSLEMSLLRYFIQNEGRAISREELMSKVWNLPNYPNTRTVDNFVSRLRRHFEPNQKSPRHFLSIRGKGYKFDRGAL